MFGLKRGGAHNIISLTPMWGLLYTLHRRRYFNPEIKPFPKFLWAKGISHSCVLVWLCLVQALIIADSYERVYGGSIRCNHNWYTLPLPPDIWRPLPNIQHPMLCLASLIYAKTYWIVIRDERLHRSSYYRSIQDPLSSYVEPMQFISFWIRSNL